MPFLPAYSAAEPVDPTPAPEGADASQPHNAFDRERQVRFLEGLSITGNVRSACRSASISPQTAYRFRRGDRPFAQAWNAALLAARVQVEDVLADRALNGVEEAVYYHGEEVARRRRYDSRLLLAHLGRLDKLADTAALIEAAGDFDNALEIFREHGALQPPPPPPPPRSTRTIIEAEGDPYAFLDEDDDADDGSSWRTPSPRVTRKSARELEVADLYRLSEEDFTYLYDRLTAQQAADAVLGSDRGPDAGSAWADEPEPDDAPAPQPASTPTPAPAPAPDHSPDQAPDHALDHAPAQDADQDADPASGHEPRVEPVRPPARSPSPEPLRAAAATPLAPASRTPYVIDFPKAPHPLPPQSLNGARHLGSARSNAVHLRP